MSKRQALQQTAEQLVRSRGFDAFSYADLAERVGIRKASIHYHFPTKSSLAQALIEDYAQRFMKQLELIASKDQTASVSLRAYLDLYRKALQGGQQLCLCVAYSASRDSFEPQVLEVLDQFNADSQRWLTQIFERAVKDKSVTGVGHPEDEATATVALVQGAQLLARTALDAGPFERATQAFRARLT